MYCMKVSHAIPIDSRWIDLASAIRERPGVRTVYVIGAPDRGKSVLCRYLAGALSRESPAAYVDCDPGQSSIGPPGTIGMQGLGPAGVPAGRPLLYFIGSTSPRGHTLACMSGVKRLAGKADALGYKIIIIDSSGFVLSRAAQEFQYHLIDLLEPDVLAAIQRGNELEALLGNFAVHPGITIHRIPVSPAVAVRTQRQRRRHRQSLFRAYFRDAFAQDLDISGMGMHGMTPATAGPLSYRSLLTAMCDPENLAVVLGITVSFHPEKERLSLFAPSFHHHDAASIQFGSLYLDLNEYSERTS